MAICKTITEEEFSELNARVDTVVTIFAYILVAMFVTCLVVVFLWYKNYKKPTFVIVLWILIAIQVLAIVAKDHLFREANK